MRPEIYIIRLSRNITKTNKNQLVPTIKQTNTKQRPTRGPNKVVAQRGYVVGQGLVLVSHYFVLDVER